MVDRHLPLQPAEQDQLAKARDWIKGHFTGSRDERYRSIDQKLHVIAVILSSDWIRPDETWKLQSLGIAFGDALAQELMLEWVTIEDEYGCDPALHWPGTSIYVFPLTMISKRIEAGETVDITAFFADVRRQITEIAFSGDAR